MAGEEIDMRSSIRIKVTANKIETEQICAILRGLLYSQGQSDGQTKKNTQFKAGCVVNFGMNMTMLDFIAQVDQHLSEATRSKIALNVLGD